MTKAELISRIVDSFWDISSEEPEEYFDLSNITLEEADGYLKEERFTERMCDLEPDECLPNEVTPELYMEAWNCYLRYMKFEARVERLADWIREEAPVCEYANYYCPVHEDAIQIYPTDYIWDEFPFDLIDDLSNNNPMWLIKIGQNSPDFDFNDPYCWFEKDKFLLHGTDNPFTDGTLDAKTFARFIMLDNETFEYMFDHIIDDEDAKRILGCTKEEYING